MLGNQRVQGFLGMLLATAVLLLASCSEEPQEHIAPAIHPQDSVSTMTSYGVNTLISDSGVIKYRIVTERWDVNTIRMPNRWEFMKIRERVKHRSFCCNKYIQVNHLSKYIGI